MPMEKKFLIYIVVLVLISYIPIAHALPLFDIGKLKLIDPKVLRCNRITEKIDKKTTNYDEAHSKHIGIYNKLLEKLKNLSTRLKNAGYDVDTLENDIDQLEDKIKIFKDAYSAYIDKLKATKNFACGSGPDDDFKNATKEAKAQLKIAKEAAQNIREFYVSVIKPDIQDILDQK